MFPRPIAQRSRAAQLTYQALLPAALILWLLPLLGIAMTSIKPSSDLASGNYFGLPSHIALENYWSVLFDFDLWKYIRNSFVVTIPTVIGAVALSCLTGFALGIHRF